MGKKVLVFLLFTVSFIYWMGKGSTGRAAKSSRTERTNSGFWTQYICKSELVI